MKKIKIGMLALASLDDGQLWQHEAGHECHDK